MIDKLHGIIPRGLSNQESPIYQDISHYNNAMWKQIRRYFGNGYVPLFKDLPKTKQHSYLCAMIRRGNPNDALLLQTLGTKTFDDTFGNTCTKDDMKYVLDLFFNEKQCLEELSDDLDNFFFYEEEGIAKGYMRINKKHECPIDGIKNSAPIELVRLYVLKDYHGAGIANALMDYAFEFAKSQGCQTIYLSVWEYNFRARGFYEKHGFKNTGIKNDFPLGSTPQTDYWFVKTL